MTRFERFSRSQNQSSSSVTPCSERGCGTRGARGGEGFASAAVESARKTARARTPTTMIGALSLDKAPTLESASAMRLSLALLLVAGVARADAPRPLVTVTPSADRFIDDAFALRADGKALAYVTTDGASLAELHLR